MKILLIYYLRFNFLFVPFWIILVIPGCKNEGNEKSDKSYQATSYTENDNIENEQPLFTLLDSLKTGISFINPIIESEQINIITYEYLYNGGGISAGDINNDGLVDLYFTGNMVPNKLYLNQGDFKFKDITISSGTDGGMGFKSGVTMVDINGDGFLDIYICKTMLADPQYRKNVLYINNGNLTFSENAAAYGIDDASYSNQAYFFDMDTDGDLDLYLLNHQFDFKKSNTINVAYNSEGKLEIAEPTDYTYISDRLYENKDGHYTDITQQAGVQNDAFGLSVAVGDFNNDFKPDLYVCNDYIKPDNLYINNGDNTFTDKFSDFFQHSSFSSMGSDLADINNDGCLDLMTLDMLPRDHYRQNMLGMAQNFDKFQKMIDYGYKAQYSINALQLNDCNGKFGDISFLSNTAYTDWSWSVLLADYDNDGWKDMYITNGYKRDVTNNDYAQYIMDSLQKLLIKNKITLLQWVNNIPSVKTNSYFFKNSRNLSFNDVSLKWSNKEPAFSNGASYADLNNDGYLDLIVNNIDAAPFIYKNEGKNSRNNNFIRFIPSDEKSNTVWGTKVIIHASTGETQVQHLYPTRGFLSSTEPVLHFGLGKAKAISKVEVVWPDGKSQIVTNPEINATNKIKKEPTGKYNQPKGSKNIFFTDKSNRIDEELSHKENPYNDFNNERLLHQKYSEEGPAISVGDINGDQLDDIFIGGAEGYSSKILLQKKNGNFVVKENNVFEIDKLYEDVASILIDVNKDGKNDLIVISGGNEKPITSEFYRHRLYLNDGNGNFKKSEKFPDVRSSGGSVTASDIDSDGDLDIFIGGRVSPGRYPVIPKSYVLINNNGIFVDETKKYFEGLENIGMITDSRFVDIDKDGKDELVLVGEWMPISVFKLNNNKFINISNELGLSNFTGWWYSLEIADINNDGFPEIIAGNLGLNSHIQTSTKNPVTLHYKDFDNNGSIDPIVCCYNSNYNPNKSFPLHFRDRLIEQMPTLKKKFNRYNQYANADLNDIFSKEQLQDQKILTANTFAHMLFINNGGKKFTGNQLPRYTQISSIRSIEAFDINNDKNIDLLIGGNLFGTDAQIGRYDASVGAVLVGNGKGDFEVVGPQFSGFSIPGDVRKIIKIKAKSGENVLVIRNNDKFSLFSLNNY